ncbi:hypothetical protein L1049_002706 [Liquidambar formosana]|uniref:Uncharacterized protein n=1 Tax=Liquidambar formosana TaxID=63359 RepID=A0AAP0NGA3_LIQFO
MKSASLFSPALSRQPFSIKSPCRKRSLLPSTNNVVTAVRGTNGRDYGGNLVDENMIVLRIRIREMRMLETDMHHPRVGWIGRSNIMRNMIRMSVQQWDCCNLI